MLICGIKLTHDGAVALIDGNRLIFCTELEKLNNNKRFTAIEDTRLIEEIISKNGYSLNDIDQFVIDGWGGFDNDALAIQPRLEIGDRYNQLSVSNYGQDYKLDLARYREHGIHDNILEEWNFEGLEIGAKQFPYSSYLHVTGHVMSAYYTSPFANKRESSFVLVWDGGMYPRLYYFDVIAGKMENLGPIFLLIGNIYTIFSQHFGPFKTGNSFAKDDLSIAGKVMAYIALGKVREELFPIFEDIYASKYDKPMGFANIFANEFKNRIAGENIPDEDVLRSFHVYLERLLVSKLEKKIQRSNKKTTNLCLAGGCALNIKWNSAIRGADFLQEVYVPPFPNDSGSAIGVACAALFNQSQSTEFHWSVYSGPEIKKNEPAESWKSKKCSLEDLASLLHTKQEPVIFLHNKAELGPRALGNRSILAPPTNSLMKKELNRAKQREAYRPISPMCLEDAATTIFHPGTPDPFMLFDHKVRNNWRDKIPAICHLDGTARLQTINHKDCEWIAKLLTAYRELSGVPVLCNTSANYNGKGFFPDILSATIWGRENGVHHVWCDDVLYTNETRDQEDTGMEVEEAIQTL